MHLATPRAFVVTCSPHSLSRGRIPRFEPRTCLFPLTGLESLPVGVSVWKRVTGLSRKGVQAHRRETSCGISMQVAAWSQQLVAPLQRPIGPCRHAHVPQLGTYRAITPQHSTAHQAPAPRFNPTSHLPSSAFHPSRSFAPGPQTGCRQHRPSELLFSQSPTSRCKWRWDEKSRLFGASIGDR